MIWMLSLVTFWMVTLSNSPLDIDYTSGELLDHLLSWIKTGNLYTPLGNAPYRVLNYPPLFLFAAQALSKIGFNPLFAGRFLNFLAFLSCVLILFLWLRQAGCRPVETLFIIALLGCSYPILYSTGQFHLELSAVALSMGGLYFLSKAESWLPVTVSGILLALSCFVKQTQVIPALIAIAWLFHHHRKQLIPFLTVFVLFGVTGSILIQQNFGEEVWRQMVLYTVGTFSFSQLIKQLISYFLPWSIFFILALRLGFINSKDRKDLRWWYFVGSTLTLLSSARLGAGSQYFIEWSFATLLWIGPWVKKWMENKGRRGEFLLKYLLLLQILGTDIGSTIFLLYDLKNLHETQALLPKLCAELPPLPTLIPTESPAIVLACGYHPALHPFIMANLSSRGLWDEKPFVEQLQSKNYPVLLLPFDPKKGPRGYHEERWTPFMIQAMAENYGVTKEIGDWKILKPL